MWIVCCTIACGSVSWGWTVCRNTWLPPKTSTRVFAAPNAGLSCTSNGNSRKTWQPYKKWAALFVGFPVNLGPPANAHQRGAPQCLGAPQSCLHTSGTHLRAMRAHLRAMRAHPRAMRAHFRAMRASLFWACMPVLTSLPSSWGCSCAAKKCLPWSSCPVATTKWSAFRLLTRKVLPLTKALKEKVVAAVRALKNCLPCPLWGSMAMRPSTGTSPSASASPTKCAGGASVWVCMASDWPPRSRVWGGLGRRRKTTPNTSMPCCTGPCCGKSAACVSY